MENSELRNWWAELRFMTRATELNFIVAKPWGDSPPSISPSSTAAASSASRSNAPSSTAATPTNATSTPTDIPYRPDQIDFFAAYVIPTDTWYILPIKATHHQPDILLTPHSKNAKYEKYKEAWHLLKR